MERAASARLSSGTYSASWFVARALWVVLHVFLWTRSAGRAAVDRAFRVSGLAFLEPRRGLSFCARRLRRALEVDPDARPEWRLSNLIYQRRARWLLERTDRLILD